MGNDQRKILRMMAAGTLKRDGFQHVTVEHDDWCRLLNTGGQCDCDPNVLAGQPDKPALAHEVMVMAPKERA